jgi:glutamine phosphoribosylpyrophosphate amidotransferase
LQVIPVPETSRASALQCAYTLGVPFREGFIKNRYIARTFIMPGQAARKKSVKAGPFKKKEKKSRCSSINKPLLLSFILFAVPACIIY